MDKINKFRVLTNNGIWKFTEGFFTQQFYVDFLRNTKIYTLGKFINQYDKNCKEIYEGDIICIYNLTTVNQNIVGDFEFEKEDLHFVVAKDQYNPNLYYPFSKLDGYSDFDNVEVVDNIYESNAESWDSMLYRY